MWSLISFIVNDLGFSQYLSSNSVHIAKKFPKLPKKEAKIDYRETISAALLEDTEPQQRMPDFLREYIVKLVTHAGFFLYVSLM